MDGLEGRLEERPDEPVATEISSKNLPPLTYREIPRPKPLRRLIGPGVVVAAAGIGSGEFVLWPLVSQRVGLGFLWAALMGSLIMFFIATECVRYTLSTGETIITGFTRLWKPWWIGFIIMAVVPNIWPGYATGTATVVSFLAGGGDIVLVTVLFLLAITLSLILSPIVYRVMEKIEMGMMAIMLLFIIVAAFVAIRADVWGEALSGFSQVGRIPQGIPFPVLAGAVAFAGAGGLGVLIVSNYAREKRWGMGAHIPRVVSPITGREEPGSNIGHFFVQSDENLRRWRGWWNATNREQFFTFFLFTIVTIFIMSILAYSTVYGEDVGEGFDFIRAEGEVLATTVGVWFKNFFWIAGALALLSTNLGQWDFIGRICADAMRANWLRASEFWTESKVYTAFIIGIFLFSTAILLSGLQEPVVLLVITSVLNGVTSFIYCALIVQLNRFGLPRAIRMGNIRFVIMSFAVVFYGFFFIVTVVSLFGLFGG